MNKMTIHKGFAALTTTLVIMVILILFLVSGQIIASHGLIGSIANRLGSESGLVAQSCLEDTLITLRSNPEYVGENLNIADGYCIIDIVDSGPNTKTITINANTLGQYFQNIVANVSITETADTIEVILIDKTRF